MRVWLGMGSRVWTRGGGGGYHTTWATTYGGLQGSPNPATGPGIPDKGLKVLVNGNSLLAYEFVT